MSRTETVAAEVVSNPREQAIDAALRWLKFEEAHAEAEEGQFEVTRDLVAGMFDAAAAEGDIAWSGEHPALLPGPTAQPGVDADLLDKILELQDVRNRARAQGFTIMNELASVAGLTP
jgi:hypothetical protein